MLKADAYNHGVVGVVKVADNIVDRYGVATLDEALGLRALGVAKPISLFGFESIDAEQVIKNNITPVVFNQQTLETILNFKYNNFDIKIDTGMKRFGFLPGEEVHRALERIEEEGLKPRAIHTHLYSTKSIKEQKEVFDSVVNQHKYFLKDSKQIVSASIGVGKGLVLDGVRVGLLAYRGALEIESEVLAIKQVKRGESVGYDGRYVAEKDTQIAIISGGYYDGIKRSYKGAKVLLGGQYGRIVGNVCMDSTLVDAGQRHLNVYDKVILINNKTIDSFIKVDRSNEYEVITSIKGRAKRIYLYNGQRYDKITN